MKRLLLSLLLIAAATPALNACSTDSSTLGYLGTIPADVMHQVMLSCGPHIHKVRSLNNAGKKLADDHVAAVTAQISNSPCMAGASEAHITDYAHAVIRTGKAPQWVHDVLIKAAKVGDVATVTWLLTAPFIDVNAHDLFRWTALIYAASNGRAEVVRLLLAAPGIDVNARTSFNSTALTLVTFHGHAEVVSLLLAAGADVNVCDNQGKTALHYAIDNEVIRLLLAAPRIDINARNKDGATALDYARARGHDEIATMIETHLAAHPEAAAH